MSIIFQQLWLGIIVPVLVSGIVLLVGWKPWKRTEETPRPAWSIALALPAAYLAVHIGIADFSELIPGSDLDWMVHIALLAAIAGVAESILWERTWVRWVLRAALLVVGIRLTVGFMFDNEWATVEGAAYVAAITAIGLALIATLERLGERHHGATLPIAFILVGSVAAVILAQAGTAKVAQMLGGLTAAAGVTLPLAWWRNDINLARGGATAFGVIFIGLVTHGYFALPEVPSMSQWSQNPHLLALIATLVAPHLLWGLEFGIATRLKGWKGTTARALLLVVALAGAASLTVAIEPPPEPEENTLDDIDYEGMY